jgi:hypothetical protein
MQLKVVMALIIMGMARAQPAASAFLGPPCWHGWRCAGGPAATRALSFRCRRQRPQSTQSKTRAIIVDPCPPPVRCVTANPLHMPAEGLWCNPSFGLDDNRPPNSAQLIRDEVCNA